MSFDESTPIGDLLTAYIRYAAKDEWRSGEIVAEHVAAADELRRRDAELAALKAAPTPWDRLPYAEKQRREAAMHRVAGAAGHGASVTTDFPWQGRTSISGSWDIEDLRKLLAAMEGR
jgi:hypothetical protein